MKTIKLILHAAFNTASAMAYFYTAVACFVAYGAFNTFVFKYLLLNQNLFGVSYEKNLLTREFYFVGSLVGTASTPVFVLFVIAVLCTMASAIRIRKAFYAKTDEFCMLLYTAVFLLCISLPFAAAYFIWYIDPLLVKFVVSYPYEALINSPLLIMVWLTKWAYDYLIGH